MSTLQPTLDTKQPRQRASEAPSSYREQLRAELQVGRLLRLGAIALQFVLIVVAMRLLNLESAAFKMILTVALGGFLVNHFLPAAWRLTFFAMLSVASVPMVLGGPNAAWLLGIGCVLIALCHVPAPIWVRVVLVLGAGLVLMAERIEILPANAPDIPDVIGPILVSMFLCRLIVYIHDLKHGAGPFGVRRALAYFFMLPNVCFPLFPVVDYKTFQRSVYNEEPLQLYQTGVKWMLRGLVHLALYKLVYLLWIIEPSQVVDGTDFARYIFANFALYLKVSGTFHMIAGLLRMFGFGVSETHHLYFFASSFLDLWRRMNIYWKEFNQKVLFNPIYFALRKKQSETRALTLAAMFSFTLTWVLHSLQWFWVLGKYPVSWSEAVFWIGFFSIAIVNMLREARMGRQRSLVKHARTLRQDVVLALQIATTFGSICVLWAIWYTSNPEDLEHLGRALLNSGPADIAVLLGVPLLIGVLGVLFGQRNREASGVVARTAVKSNPFWRQAAMITLVASAFVVVALRPALLAPVSPTLATLVGDVRSGRLNQADMNKMQRGYYAEVGDTARVKNPELDVMFVGRPADWDDVGKIRRLRDDAIGVEFVPSTSALFKGAQVTINSLGFRDREYAKEPGPNTFRIALIGSSHDMGTGVNDNETYENLVEDRLNRELGPLTGKKYEILNLSFGGYDPVQKLAVIQQKIYALHPDLILFAAYSVELDWTFRSTPRLIKNNIVDQFPAIASALQQAGIDITKPLPTDAVALENRLKPYAAETLGAILKTYREDAAQHGTRPAVLLMESPDDSPARTKGYDRVTQLVRSADLPIIDMQGVFAGVSDRKSLWIASWDTHTNAGGHRMLADRLYTLLVEQGYVPTKAAPAAQTGRGASR